MNKIFFLIPLLLFSFGLNQTAAADFVVLNATSTESGKIIDFGDGGGCGLPTDSKQLGLGNIQTQRAAQGFSPFGDVCANAFMTYSISAIPNGATIDNVEWITDVNETFGSNGCDVGNLPNLPSTYTNDALWTATYRITEYVTDGAFCENDATGVVIDLGSAADTDVTNELFSNNFSFSVSLADSGDDGITFTNNQLNVTYTYIIPPDPPKQFFGDFNDWHGVNFSWVAGEINDDTHDDYTVEYYNGTAWVSETTTASTTYLENTPPDLSTTPYRIVDNGATNTGCSTFAMNNTLTANLIGHWPLCNTINDSSTNDDDLVSGIGDEIYIAHNGKPYFDFNETAYYEATAGDTIFNFTSTDPFTINYWMFAEDTTFSTGVVLKSTGLGVVTGYKTFVNGAGNMIFRIGNGTDVWDVSGNTVDDATPHMITAVKTSTADNSAMSIYKDGVLTNVGISGAIIGDITNTFDLRVGNIAAANGTTDVSDIRIFDTDLDAHQIDQLYNEYIDTPWQPFAMDTITASVVDLDTIRLDFTPPSEWRGTTCYDINYTTPLGDPQTVAETCVAVSGAYLIDGLETFANDYSFRMGVVNPHGTNSTGVIANATSFSAFDIGDVQLPQGENPNVVDIAFVEFQHNLTQTDLQVVYDETYDLACDFSYKYGRTNQTYSGLTETTVTGTTVYTNFTLNDPEFEIITVYCWDTLNNVTDGTYLITQTSIPIVDQVNGFQDGLYGTDGKFGVLDLMTLFVVMISMIGFNRYNPALGAIIMVMTMGAMSYFGVIQWESTVMGVVALGVMLAIIQVRKT